MKTLITSNNQIKSLRKTTSTKKQVLERIQESSIEELRSLAPHLSHEVDKKAIIKSANIILDEKATPNFSDFNVESIILSIGRPVFFIKDGKPILRGDDIDKWKTIVDNAITNLSLLSSIKSIGRIETKNLPGYTWLGTGWLYDRDLLVTNRHVADYFVQNAGSGFSFQSFFNKIVEPQVDFLAEHESAAASEFKILKCIYKANSSEPDIAVFQIKFNNNDEYQPLAISDIDPRVREDVVAIGYPAFDSRINEVEDMERIYQGVYDVKRIAPGKITGFFGRDGIAEHDASTLGGNSGSAIISLETGKVVGLHFVGKEKVGNYCITGLALKNFLRRLPKASSSFNGFSTPKASDLDGVLQEMVGRQCALEDYNKIQVPSFKISGRLHAYASPDSTYAVTQMFFKKAEESILIGIYDFTADHMVACITDAIDRGVSVSLMLDIDSDGEKDVIKKLKKYGVECVPAPSCASKNVSYFASSHEKVIVIDNKWTLIQSGNYSNNSIPFNSGDGDATDGFRTGNRDMGIALESVPLAKFFTKVLRSDMKLELSAAGEESIEGRFSAGEFLLEAPRKRPDILFPSQQFNFSQSVNVQPVLSPDNYMDIIPDLLKSATSSIRIEQQYIRVDQPLIKKLLMSIPKDISVQIIVAPPIGNPDKTAHEVQVLQDEYGFEVRLLSKKHFVHCHNKLIVIDDNKVLISSQNWSDSAVAKNREAGVIIANKEITEYYSKIFDADWTMSDDGMEEGIQSLEVNTNLESFGLAPGKYVRVDAGDIQEV